jgi:hypothetical protein
MMLTRRGIAISTGLATLVALLPLLPATPAAAQPPQEDLARWVNPYTGTKPGGEDHGTGGGAGNTSRMPYRSAVSGTPQQITTYLFATAPIELQTGKQVASVTLPSTVDGGTAHVFAITAG